MCTVTLSLKHVVCFHSDSGDPPSTSGHCPLLSIPDYNRYSLRAAAARWLAAPVWLSTSHAAMYSRDDTGDVVTIVT